MVSGQRVVRRALMQAVCAPRLPCDLPCPCLSPAGEAAEVAARIEVPTAWTIARHDGASPAVEAEAGQTKAGSMAG